MISPAFLGVVASAGKSSPLLNGLTHYWSFDSDADDLVGSVNGTVTGAVNNAGKIGNGYSFAGGSDEIAMSPNIAIDEADAMSLGFWCYINSFNSAFPSLLVIDTTSSYPWEILLSNVVGFDTLTWGSRDTWTSGRTNSISAASWPGVWRYITFTKAVGSGGAQTLYIDGVSQTILTVPTYAAKTNTTLFGRTPTFGNSLDGKLDEIGLWNRELTSGEVSDLYNSGSGLAYPF